MAYDDLKGTAKAVALAFDDWSSSTPQAHWTAPVADVAPYEPGAFYKRELPCLLAVLELVTVPMDVIIVDGHGWLNQRPGLGHHLFLALDAEIPVVGIAKRAFKNGSGIPVVRGSSSRPLFVSASGMSHAAAANCVGQMHGPNRLPTMLQLVDALTKEH